MDWRERRSVSLSAFFSILLLIVNVYVCVLLYLDIGTPASSNISPSRELKALDDFFYSLNSMVDTQPMHGIRESSLAYAVFDYYFLVVMVLSSPTGKERRDGVRQTWMKGYKERTPNVSVKFSIGIEGLSSKNIEILRSENVTHGDLLFLPHLQDSYSNLTRKVLESFVAISSHHKFSYLMKCDDDTFIVLNTILKELEKRKSRRNYYWGYHYKNSVVRRSGKWAEEKWFLCDTYFPYAAGGGYILSQDLVRHLSANSDSLTLYHNEDVSMGAWLSPYNTERRHDVRFKARPTDVNCEKDIVIHYQTVEDMRTRQKSLKENGRIC